MSEPTGTWAANGSTLICNGRATGYFASDEIAEWVADACNTLAEMDQAQAEWEASGEAAHCAMVDIGGERMRMQGGATWTEQDRREMSQLVSAAKQRMAEAQAAERAEIERQVREEIAARIERVVVIARRDMSPVDAKADAFRIAAQIARGDR